MRIENHIFKLSNGDECDVLLTELNHRVFSVLPSIQLTTHVLPEDLFQNVVDHIIKLGYNHINKLYFENVKFHYKLISFNLFGHIRSSLRVELRKPVMYDKLVSGKDDYKWIESGFLPNIPKDVDRHIDMVNNKTKNVLLAFRRGSIDGVSYTLPETYDMVYNYFFDIHATDLIPVFTTYVKINPPETTGDLDVIQDEIISKFKRVDINIIFN